MAHLLFIVYLIIFSWLVLKTPFIKNTGLGSRMILLLFLLKVMAGIMIGWLSLHYYNTGNDYWDVNREGWKEYQLLWDHPKEYFTNLFISPYQRGYTGLFDSFHSFWSDLRNNLVIKLVSVFDFFSRGNYYINSLFFNYIVFFGHVIAYRLFIAIYPGRTIPVIIGCFLLPSLLYFSSGVHKDGLVFLLLAMLVYAVYNSIQKQNFSIKRISIIVISLLLLFLIRSFVAFSLIPALIAWILAARMRWPVWAVFTIVYLIAGLIFFNISLLFPAADPLKVIVQRQADYMQLPRSSTPLELDTLRPDFNSFLNNAPQSLSHILMRPYLTELPSGILLPMNIELFCYQLLFLIALFFHLKNPKWKREPAIPFFILFTLTVFLFIGYIIPNLGSLIRYRSLYLPFIITPILCRISLKKVDSLSKIK